MTLFVPFNEKEELKKLQRMHQAWREGMKREFTYLCEELEDEFEENPCADNYETYLDVKEFVENYDKTDVETIKRMRDEYRLYAQKYDLHFY